MQIFSYTFFGIFLRVLYPAVLILLPVVVFGNDINRAPVFQSVSKQYVLEGERLNLTVVASDPDGDAISLAVTARPQGISFIDNGNGTAQLGWTPDFSGPNSSVGSPFNLQFVAGDGLLASSIAIEVVVINKNRCPSIMAPDTLQIQSGSALDFDIFGNDPDFDITSWRFLSHPDGMEITQGNPGKIDWPTHFSDSGLHAAVIELTDLFGAADTARVVLKVLQTTVYDLAIDTVHAYSGEIVEVSINIANLEPVAAMNLLVNYDASVLTFIQVSRTGTRIENWEEFNYILNDRGISGDIRLTGTADILNNTVTDVLAPGDGAVVKLSFYISHNLAYAGYSIPVVFAFRDILIGDDNTMTMPSGEQIVQDMIGYANGFVKIESVPENGIGDINMNGITFEIGDAIYYTNHFINPALYQFSAIQLFNSDVNHDGYGSTIADLVYLINTMLKFESKLVKVHPDGNRVDIMTEISEGNFTLMYASAIELGGMTVTLEFDEPIDGDLRLISAMEQQGLSLKSSIDGRLMRLVIVRQDEAVIPSGLGAFVTIENKTDFKIKEIQLSTVDGFVAEPVLKDAVGILLPAGYILYQNYPNPFNPTTAINFELPEAVNISLTIYNILGQEIIRLADGLYGAGNHSVVWNGQDAGGRVVASGIYFYRLQSGEFSDQKKMILLK